MTAPPGTVAAGPSLGRRLTTSYAVLVGLVVLVGLSGVAAVTIIVGSADRMSRSTQPAVQANRAALLSLTQAQSGVRGYLYTGDRSFLGRYARDRADWLGHMHELEALGDGRSSALAGRERDAGEAWLDRYGDRAVAASGDGGWAAAQQTWDSAAAHDLFERFRRANTAVDRRLSTEIASAHEHQADVRRLVLAVLVLGTFLSVLLGGFTGWRTIRGLVRPLARLRSAVRRLGSGQADARADVGDGPGEVRALAEAINALADESDRLREADQQQARNRRLAHDVGLRIRDAIDVGSVVRIAVEEIGASFGADRVILRLVDGDRLTPLSAEWHEYDVAPLDRPALTALSADHSTETVASLWAAGETLAVSDLAASEDEAAPASWPQALRDLRRHDRARAVLLAPFGAGPTMLGTLTLVQLRHPRTWAAAELTAVQTIAADLGRAVQHALIYGQERKVVERLRALDRTKSDFLSTVSHELRTPLTSITGYVELLRDGDGGPVSDGQVRMLEVIDRSVGRLRALIEDLLTLSRIESGAFRTETRPVDVAALLRQAAATVQPSVDAAELTLVVDVCPEALTVTGDPAQLDRVLLNLLSNAVKFSRGGGQVSARAWLEEDSIVLRFEDKGIGIPAAEQDRLFSRFFRATNATDLAIPGTGLGLTIVRSIVEHHHGTLDVRSVEGVGTTVELRLPCHGRDRRRPGGLPIGASSVAR